MTTSNIDVLSALMAARMLISDGESWTQGTYAKDKSGIGAITTSEHACSWCAYGAVLAVIGQAMPWPKVGCAVYELSVTANDLITRFNDTHTHAEVLDAFDATIERLS